MTIAIECDVLDILCESQNRTYSMKVSWALLIGIDSLCVRFSLTMPKTIKSLHTLSNVDDGETVPTPVTTVLSLQNLMDANKFLVFFNAI